MKEILLTSCILLVVIAVVAGGKGGGGGGRGGRGGTGGKPTGGYRNSAGQRPPPQTTNNINGNGQQTSNDYYGPPPPPNNNLAGARLAAWPSRTLSEGASVTLTCKFTLPIYPQLVYFTTGVGDNTEDSSVLVFDSSSTAMGQTVMIADQISAVINDYTISLMFYKAAPSDSGVYQCYIPDVATSNVLPLTVTAHSDSSPQQNKTVLIVAITVPSVIVLLAIIAILVLYFCYGYRCHGMCQIRRVQHQDGNVVAESSEEVKKAAGKPDVLDPAKLPSYDYAANAQDNYSLPPGYDDLVYGENGDTNVQVKPNGAHWKGNVA